MRRIIVTIIMSLDGYVEGTNRHTLAMNVDAAFDAYILERLKAADTLLYGEHTYRAFMQFWPALADHDSASPTHQEIGRLQRDLQKVVVSDCLADEQLGAHAATTSVIAHDEAYQHITQLKHGPGRDILILGSRALWNELLEAGLVDEFHAVVGSEAIGAGVPAFRSARPPMTLLEHRGFDGSDNVLLRYHT